MTEKKIRCFRRVLLHCEDRPGVWVMASERVGTFFHGTKEEAQRPRYTISELVDLMGPQEVWFQVEEISPQQALEQIKHWPLGQEEMQKIFNNHMKKVASTEEK